MLYGQPSGQSKTASPSDIISPPKRIVFDKQKGVFLNEKQEQLTLEKLLWKEQYREDAVTMYWVSVALEEKNDDLIEQNKFLSSSLSTCEVEMMSAVKIAADSKKESKELSLKNNDLRLQNYNLKVGNFIWKGISISLAGVIVWQFVKF